MKGSFSIGVVGAGATGGYLAAVLANANYPVTIVARGQSRERIAQQGLIIERPGDSLILAKPAKVVEPGETTEPVDVVLFCVKSYDTDAALSGIDGLMGKNGRVLCLQNGVVNEDTLTKRFGSQRVISGVMYIGSERTAPGCIRVNTPARVFFGSPEPSNQRLIEQLKAAFDAAGVECSVNERILTDKWQKFFFNCGLNPLTAIVGMKLGAILGREEGKILFEALIDEAIAVANKAGAPLAADARDRVLDTARRMDISSSMAEDLASGRPIERDAFTGHVRRLGETLGVSTPVTAVFDQLLALKSAKAG
ncbi:MAG: ketopantoate reductase family protein [Terriglobia bacterium]